MSDGVHRDLRRGVIRSLPLAGLGGLVAIKNAPLGVALATCAFGWVPLTLIEGRVRLREGNRWIRMVVTVGLGWALIALMAGGCWLQYHYLKGLKAGLDPVTALQTIRADGLLTLTVILGILFGVVLTTGTAARVVAGDPDHHPKDLLGIAALQIGGLALAVGLAFLADGGSFLAGACSIGFFLPVFGLPLFAFAVWPWVRRVDRIEARFWPPERRRRTPQGPPSEPEGESPT